MKKGGGTDIQKQGTKNIGTRKDVSKLERLSKYPIFKKAQTTRFHNIRTIALLDDQMNEIKIVAVTIKKRTENRILTENIAGLYSLDQSLASKNKQMNSKSIVQNVFKIIFHIAIKKVVY